MDTAFISYSRADLHLVISLTAHLLAADVDPWLDVARLSPGVDWNREVDAAIDSSEVLVLVASRASLKSPAVEREWLRAQAQGKPIHVAVIEPVKLPAELAALSLHDLRAGFSRGAHRLGRAVATSTGSTDRYRPSVPRFPLATLWLGAALLAPFVLSCVEIARDVWSPVVASDDAPDVAVLVALWSFQTALPFVLWRAYAGRRLTALGTFLAVLAPWLPLLGFAETRAVPVEPAVLAGAVVLVLGSWLMIALSPDFIRRLPSHDTYSGGWVSAAALPVHSGPRAWWRWVSDRLHNQDFLSPTRGLETPMLWLERIHGKGASTSSPSIVSVECGTWQDAFLAARIRAFVEDAGATIAEDAGSSRRHLVVVSADTPKSWLAAGMRRWKGIVLPVLATGIRDRSVEDWLGDRQWVELRDRSVLRVRSLAELVAGRQVGSVLLLGQMAAPLNHLIVPRGVQMVTWAFLLLGGVTVGRGVYDLFEPAGLDADAIRPGGDVASWAPAFFAVRGILLIGTGALVAWIALGLLRRRLSAVSFVLWCAGAVATFGALVVASERAADWEWSQPQAGDDPAAVHWLAAFLPVLPVALCTAVLSSWLPRPGRRRRPRPEAPTLGSPRVPWSWYALLLAAVGGTIAVDALGPPSI